MRVLIVDDAIELGRVLKDTLKTVHPEILVSVVPSAEEALLESGRLNIDLLVTDLRLPGMTGIELVQKIRRRQPNVKVVLITGLAEDDWLVRQRETVAPDAFMRKPISTNEFLAVVESLTGAGQLQQTAAQPQIDAHAEAPRTAKQLDMAGAPAELTLSQRKTAPLAASGAGQQPFQEEPEETAEGPSGVLSRLRGSLGALSTILLDESGHVVARAGELPDFSIDDQILAPLMTAISSGAKVSYLLGQPAAQTVQAFRGANFDIVAAPVGQYTLLVGLRSTRSSIRMALAFEEAFTAQVELTAALDAMGLHIQSGAELNAQSLLMELASEPQADAETALAAEALDTPLAQDPELDKFEELFLRNQSGQIQLEDPDAFWEEAEKGKHVEGDQPGVLSFDQAQKLGLLPEEKDE